MPKAQYEICSVSIFPIALSATSGRALSWRTEKNSINKKELVIAIPPRKDAALSANYDTSPTARDHNILFVEKYGKYRWQDYSDYHYRALAETAMFRYKIIVGEKMFSRDLLAQKVESNIGCLVLNKMADLGMPISEKTKRAS